MTSQRALRLIAMVFVLGLCCTSAVVAQIITTRPLCPDLLSAAIDSGPFAGVNQPMMITFTIRTNANAVVPWIVRLDGNVVKSGTNKLAAGTSAQIAVQWLPPDLNMHTVEGVLDPSNTLQDCQSGNNVARLSIGAPQVASATIAPNALLAAGSTASLTATLTEPAAVPVTVDVTSSQPAVVGTADCVVPATQVSCTASVKLLSTVWSATSVMLNARTGSVARSALLSVTPVSIASFAASPSSLKSAGSLTALTAKLSTAPTSYANVHIATSNSDLLPGGDCIVNAGTDSCTLNSTLAKTVTAGSQVTFTASLGTLQRTATVNVAPPLLVSLTSNAPSLRTPGSGVTLTATLDVPVTSQTAVSLSSSDPSLVDVGTCAIIQGSWNCQTHATLLSEVPSPASVTFTATFAGTSRTFVLAVNPTVTLSSVLASSGALIVPGNTSILVARASGAPTIAQPVHFTTDHPELLQLTDCSIAAGQTGCQTVAKLLATVPAPVTANVTGTMAGTQQSTNVYVIPIAVTNLAAALSQTVALNYSVAATLNANPPNDFPVAVTSSHPAIVPHFTVNVPSYSTAGTASVGWNPVAADTTVTLSSGGKSATMIAYGPRPSWLSLSPTTHIGPVASPEPLTITCSIMIHGPGPVTFPLTSSHPSLVSVPPTVTLDSTTLTTGTFTGQLNAVPLDADTLVTVTFGSGAYAKTATIFLRKM